MPEEYDKQLLQITERYVAELHAGQQPRLSSYIARYPQYADALADFFAYYTTFEASDVPLASAQSSLYPQKKRRSFQKQRETLPSNVISTLLTTVQSQQLTLAQLAHALDLSEDIVSLLEQREIQDVTLPEVLLERLSTTLGYSVQEVRAYFASKQKSLQQGKNGSKTLPKVAETRISYTLESKNPSFRAVLDASSQLSAEQKARWLTLLKPEQKAGV